MPSQSPIVLILGAGVHGAAIARDLVFNGIGVRLVDRFDIAFGATSKSSRLIHGGLRYLEYGDFKLVNESLEARERNLRLAPQFVRPLRLYIPTSERFSGLVRSAVGFFGLSRTSVGQSLAGSPGGRGFWPMRTGLAMYDALSQSSVLPKSSTMPVNTPGAPRVNARRYHWLCAYSDAQMVYPERLVLALLFEAQQTATAAGIAFDAATYSEVGFDRGVWRIKSPDIDREIPIAPDCVINATGAWGDETLQRLGVPSPPQFGGTKGSHFITWNDELHAALQGQAVYAEANDGRLVFVLPFNGGTLVGTTDETFAASAESACATEEELSYLLQLVNGVMDLRLTRDDITLHYSGVRPLPRSTAGNNAAVSRDHSVSFFAGDCPVFTLVGGKLTTWSQFATDVSDRVLVHFQRDRTHFTQDTPAPGAFYTGKFDSEGNPWKWPWTPEALEEDWSILSTETDASFAQFAALAPLFGCRALDLLRDCRGQLGRPIRGTDFTTGIVKWIIDHEWVRTLSDLVERRLMLVFAKDLRRETLIDLAEGLVAAGKLPASDVPGEISATIRRLRTYYGRKIDD